MKIGITGGAGYIASHIVWDLLELGHEIVILDNLSTGNRKNLPNLANCTFLEGDVGRPEDLDRFLPGLDCVFHFAAWKAAGESMVLPEKYSANNVRGSFLLIERMLAAGIAALVFSSSAAVYGDPQYDPIDEAHPRVPVNYYGFTKLLIEENLGWMDRLKGLRFAALRYFNAAGYDVKGRVRGLEQSPQNLLPVVMEVATGQREELQIFGDDYDTPDGTCIRDYIHANDLASAHIAAMNYIVEQKKSITVNLGSEKGLSVKEILTAAREVTGREIPARIVERRPGDPARLVASASRARAQLGWQAKHSDAKTLISSMWDVYRIQ